MLKKIGSNARFELERMLDSKGKPEALGKGEKKTGVTVIL